MNAKEMGFVIAGVIIPMFLLGLLGVCHTVTGILRGELRYRGFWWNRDHDGWGFWLVASLGGLGGLGAMLGAVWIGVRILQSGGF
jgi:hypothetical protein